MEFKVKPEKILDMTEQQIDHIFELVRKAKEADLLNGDGHGIIPSDEYEKYGINVKGLEQEFKSDFISRSCSSGLILHRIVITHILH